MTDMTLSPVAHPAAAVPLLRLPRLTLPPRWAALGLALWCTIGLNQAWWARLTQLSHEQSLSTTEQLWTALVLAVLSPLFLALRLVRAVVRGLRDK